MKGKVLVVDDEADLLRVLKLNLEDEGYDVEVAQDGKRALAKTVAWRPDVIILDVMMPEIDGWEVLGRLRQDARFKDLPVIMLTCRTEEESRLFGFQLGADDYVPKPFSVKEICARVDRIVTRSRQLSALREEHLEPVPATRGSELVMLAQKDMIYADAMQNYVYLYTADGRYLTKMRLEKLEAHLSDEFMRVHRGFIINLRCVRAFFSPRKGCYRVRLDDKDQTEVPVSRFRAAELKKRLGVITG